jgi:CDP-glucose 4,6-dehydratase
VFHLAAQAIVKDSYQDPFGTLQTNVMGTATLLEIIRLLRLEKAILNLQSVVVITSDKCYENRYTSTGYRETDPMGGYDPYSTSKGCAELVVQSYQRSFYSQLGIGLATARAGNVVGGGDWGNARLIPDIARSFSRSEPVFIRCPHAVRPWQHVLEPLSGYLLLGKLLSEDPIQFSEGWNFGPTCTELASVEEVIQLALTYWPKNNYEVESNSSFHETNLLQLDIHKAVASLGWRPTWNLETTIQKTIQWYQTYYTSGKEKACELVTEQINEFEKA